MARLVDDGYIVKQGDKIGDTAMRLEACRGLDLVDYSPPACDQAPASIRSTFVTTGSTTRSTIRRLLLRHGRGRGGAHESGISRMSSTPLG